MLPAGPLSTTPFGEILSSRQPFSTWPSDSTREFAPVTAKIAMRKSRPMTTPVSLTSCKAESASLAEDAVSGRRCVGLNNGLAAFRISGAASSISTGGRRVPGDGRRLLMEPKSTRISPAQTTHPTRIEAGKRIIYFDTIGGLWVGHRQGHKPMPSTLTLHVLLLVRFRRRWNGRCRRAAARCRGSGERRVSHQFAGVQPGRREPLNLPRRRPCPLVEKLAGVGGFLPFIRYH